MLSELVRETLFVRRSALGLGMASRPGLRFHRYSYVLCLIGGARELGPYVRLFAPMRSYSDFMSVTVTAAHGPSDANGLPS